MKGKFSLERSEFANVSNEAKALIIKMLEYKPETRPSVEQVLNDKWFTVALGKEKVNAPLAMQALTNLKTFRVD